MLSDLIVTKMCKVSNKLTIHLREIIVNNQFLIPNSNKRFLDN